MNKPDNTASPTPTPLLMAMVCIPSKEHADPSSSTQTPLEVEVTALSSTLCDSIIIITTTLYYSLSLWLGERGRTLVV